MCAPESVLIDTRRTRRASFIPITMYLDRGKRADARSYCTASVRFESTLSVRIVSIRFLCWSSVVFLYWLSVVVAGSVFGDSD